MLVYSIWNEGSDYRIARLIGDYACQIWKATRRGRLLNGHGHGGSFRSGVELESEHQRCGAGGMAVSRSDGRNANEVGSCG
jgi:hypothetical protein